MKYKNNLEKYMKESDISGLELFRKTGIAPSTISGLVNNRIVPFPGWKRRISKALDVPEEKLFPEE